MRISVDDARRRLSKAGIELRSIRRPSGRPGAAVYEIASPVGTTKLVDGRNLVGLLQDLRRMARLSS